MQEICDTEIPSNTQIGANLAQGTWDEICIVITNNSAQSSLPVS